MIIPRSSLYWQLSRVQIWKPDLRLDKLGRQLCALIQDVEI